MSLLETQSQIYNAEQSTLNQFIQESIITNPFETPYDLYIDGIRVRSGTAGYNMLMDWAMRGRTDMLGAVTIATYGGLSTNSGVVYDMGALLDIAIENYQREIIELQTAASKAQSKEELEKELGDNLLACLSCDPGEDPPGGKKKKTQGGGGGQNSYQSADGFGQLFNAGEVVYGSAEMGIQAIRQNNGAQTIGRSLGFGTQRTAQALRGTLGVVSKVGKGLGIVGYGFQFVSTGSKFVTGQTISTAEGVGFGISTVLVGAVWFTAGTAAAPFVAGAALIYGAGQLGSWIFTGNTLEENYFGK
jgi:hypothetical protein